jgi:hypothetical protein
MIWLRGLWLGLTVWLNHLVRRMVVRDLRPAARSTPAAPATESVDFDPLVAQIPSMGGTEIGQFLRALARNAPASTAIVEVGSWLGAGTAQLAWGVRERAGRQSIPIFTYDRWIASTAEIEKALKKANLTFRNGEDTLPWVMNAIRPFDVPVTFVKGSILGAKWNNGPISVYVDDASKSPKLFFHVLRTFGLAWVPGVTVLVLMDYRYWQKTGSEVHKCQKYFIENHPENFTPVEGFPDSPNYAPAASRPHAAAWRECLRLRFESLIAQQRVEPDQPLAGAMQAVHFARERVARLALESVGDQQAHVRPGRARGATSPD